jgi:hypothetical protein
VQPIAAVLHLASAAVLHLVCAAVLLLAHALFFFRGLSIEAGRLRPQKIDRLARSLSQALLPVTAISGAIALLATEEGMPLPHAIFGLAPLAAIPLVFFGRVLLHKRTQAPWLLPAINLILILAAGFTGFRIWR